MYCWLLITSGAILPLVFKAILPLIGADLAGHLRAQAAGPAEIGQLDPVALIQQKIETLDVSVQDRGLEAVQVEDRPGALQRQPSPVVPRQGDVLVLEHLPQGPFRAVLALKTYFQDQSEIGGLDAVAQEDANIGVPEILHRLTLISEIFDNLLCQIFDFQHFDHHGALAPASLINNAEALREACTPSLICFSNLMSLISISKEFFFTGSGPY